MIPSVATSFDLWLLLQQAHVVPFGRDANDFDLAGAVSVGLPTAVFERLLELQVLDSADVSLIMPMRSFRRRNATRSRLTTEESDRLVRVVRLTLAAADAFGDMERGKSWMRTPNPAMRGSRPVELVQTSVGTRVVEQILGRIIHGIGY
jgi:putative toxin-antitoxin system antitoxin component (TIGR02293 family)